MFDLAILGLLEENDLHGYELRKRLGDLLGGRLAVSFGSLYPALGRLEQRGQGHPGQEGVRHHRRRPRAAPRVAYRPRRRRRPHLRTARCLLPQPSVRRPPRTVRAPARRACPPSRPAQQRPRFRRSGEHLPALARRARHRRHRRRPGLARPAHRRRARARQRRRWRRPHRRKPMSTIRLAIAGVGNCASSLVQGIEYYKDADPTEQVPGLMHVGLGGYHVRDIEVVAAFDVDADKVGVDVAKAIHAIPVFIASDPTWAARFTEAGVPIVGDDIKSQVGATIVHRTLARLFEDRGTTIDHTYQLNFGGNMDFMNMLERSRLKSKKKSKTQSVTSQIEAGISDRDVHIGPSDHVPWLEDRKWAFVRLEGRNFGDVPLTVELKLEVHDPPNSAGVIIDAVRCAKIALDRGVGGPVLPACQYFMKSPPTQVHDDVARDALEAFITG